MRNSEQPKQLATHKQWVGGKTKQATVASSQRSQQPTTSLDFHVSELFSHLENEMDHPLTTYVIC